MVFAGAVLCMLSGIGLRMLFRNADQDGAAGAAFRPLPQPAARVALRRFTPIQAMPKWLQPLTLLNPIAYFATIVRGALIKGSGIDVLWPDFLGLGLFTLVVVSLSVWRYRSQLG